MFDEEYLMMIDGDYIRSCTTIQVHTDIPATFLPSITLLSDLVKDTVWEEAKKEIALIVIPNVSPLPYGRDIKSTILDDVFIEEMQTISAEHGFWAKMMIGAHEQYAGDYDTSEVVKLLSTSSVYTRRNPCNAATKGFRNATFTHFSPIIDTSCPGKKHEHEQTKVKEIFYRYPDPARAEDNVEDDDVPTIPILSSTSTAATHTRPASQNARAKDIPPPVKFYTQLL